MSRHYRFFTVYDFTLDDYFIQWVQSPTAETDAFWQNWMEENPEKRPVIEEARELVKAMDFTSLRPSQKEFFDVKARIDAEIAVQGSNKGERKNLAKRWMAVAATLIALAVATFVLYDQLTPGMITETTGFGETKSITLPDNSMITLNANSSIRYTKDWKNAMVRQVWLQGEAFFNIKKMVHSMENDTVIFKKFLVHSGAVNVEVLGTSFNINNRRETSEVVLATGKIALQITNAPDTAKMIMAPGDFVQYKPEEKELTKKKVDPEKFTSWRERKLYFEETTLTEVAEIIEANYGLKVVFENRKLKEIRLTGTVSTESLDTFLTVLSESIDKPIETKNGQVIIRN